MSHEILNPESLGAPRGYNHGLLAPAGGRLLFVAGQPALGPEGRVATRDFVEQFGVALDRVLAVVRAAGGEPGDIGRLTVYVTDLEAYRASLGPLGCVWRARMGRHYPAVALVEVRGLVDEGARVEIEATAVIPAEAGAARGDTGARGDSGTARGETGTGRGETGAEGEGPDGSRREDDEPRPGDDA